MGGKVIVLRLTVYPDGPRDCYTRSSFCKGLFITVMLFRGKGKLQPFQYDMSFSISKPDTIGTE